MTPILCLVFLLSGASALLFETLWFRQAGLAFGNSVWASSLVLSSFMAGLAIGNGLAARAAHRIARPLRAYALLEMVIGAAGLGLVLALPGLGARLAPALAPLQEHPAALNAVRLALAFALLLVPAAGMGFTLPLLVRVLAVRSVSFGGVLALLYGANTLGAVIGASLGEALLLRMFGVRGTGLVAAALNLLAAALALGLARATAADDAAPLRPAAGAPAGTDRMTRGANRRGLVSDRILAVAFGSGAAMLALEVVWFRFLQLFVASTGLAFALMLATVLSGIALGGLAAGALAARGLEPRALLAPAAFAGGALVVATYALFPLVLHPFENAFVATPLPILALAAGLMLPGALLSGLLFPLLGDALQREIGGHARPTGLLTLANTVGAALGSLAAGFVLLPRLGMERSLLLLAATYAAIGLVAPWPARGRRRFAIGVAALCAAALAAFPLGAMRARFLALPIGRYATPESEVIGIREGLTETVIYMQERYLGEPLHQTLLTNGFSMSGNDVGAKRYMKLFVNLPVALHPDPRSALLISFGVGSTAKALTDTASLERIDVVDISREILEMNSLVFPDPAAQPLRDPRVHVHVEDGRYFLQTTPLRFDLVTGEPPPPKNAGIVNLYTREHFRLVRDRLAEGGVATWWLPIDQLDADDARAIVRAFCDAFPDCTLWHGAGWNLMLAGTRDARGPVPEAAFEAQWRDPVAGPELRRIGIELPEQLGALFVGDAAFLDEATRGAAPLTDDRPKRLGEPNPPGQRLPKLYAGWLDEGAARERFRRSAWIASLWPPALRERTLPYFDVQRMHLELALDLRLGRRLPIQDLYGLLADTPLRTLPLWRLGTTDDRVAIAGRAAARGDADPRIDLDLGMRALSERRFDAAAERFAAAEAAAPGGAPQARLYRLLALCLGGDVAGARAATEHPPAALAAAGELATSYRWLAGRCGLPAADTTR